MKDLHILTGIIFIAIGIVTIIRAFIFRNKIGNNLKRYTVILLEREAFFKAQLYYYGIYSSLLVLTGIILLFIHNPISLFVTGIIVSNLYYLYKNKITSKGYVKLQ